MRFKGFTLFALLCFLASPVFAGNGKISGTVKDAQSGETLPGANVTVQVNGATIGATTDVDGRYFILNVVPGIYEVKATFVGYQVVTQTDVKVSLDLTTDLQFQLQPEAISQEEMVVTAERPAVEKTHTKLLKCAHSLHASTLFANGAEVDLYPLHRADLLPRPRQRDTCHRPPPLQLLLAHRSFRPPVVAQRSTRWAH